MSCLETDDILLSRYESVLTLHMYRYREFNLKLRAFTCCLWAERVTVTGPTCYTILLLYFAISDVISLFRLESQRVQVTGEISRRIHMIITYYLYYPR